MPNIWEVCFKANNYLCIQPADLRFFNGRFEGAKMAVDWVTPPFGLLYKSKKVADFTSWQIGSQAFLVSRRAMDAIRELCGDDVEFLPFATVKRTELFAVNVLRQMSIIDWPACSSDAVMFGGEYALRSDIVNLPALFKDPGTPGTTFASDELGRIAVERGLTGLQLADPRKKLGRMIVRGEPINEFPGL
jgi:hypothetical protein